MSFLKKDAGRFKNLCKRTYEMKIYGDDEFKPVEIWKIPIKALPVNIDEILSRDFVEPTPPEKYNPKVKKFEPLYENPEYKKELEKVRRLKTYATVIYGIDEGREIDDEPFIVEGEDLTDKIETLIGTGIPIGYFTDLSNAIMELTGIDVESFR